MRKELTDKDRIRAKEQYRQMPTKEKLAYIWEYHKLQFFAGALVIVFLGSMINHIFINPPKDIGFSLICINAVYDTDFMDKFIDEINTTLIDEPEKNEMLFENILFNSADGSYYIAMMQKLIAMISANEIDIMIAPSDYFGSYVKNGAFIDLATLPEFPIDMFECYTGISSDDLTEKQYGIKIGECPKLDESGIYTDDMVLGIVVNSPRIEKSIEFVKYIYNIPF